MVKINKVVSSIIESLKKSGVEIEFYKRIDVPSGQHKKIVYISIKNEREYVLKIVDVTPGMMLEDSNGVINDEIKQEIIYLSYRIFNEIEMSKKCPNLPQLRKFNDKFFEYIIIKNEAYMYYIEEKIEGEMLTPYKEKYTIGEIISFLEQMAQSIKIMSLNGYVHRDIKPTNIIEKDGKYSLIDGGICKRIEDDENITMTGSRIGTNRYLAPEQENVVANMRWSFQTDLYPLGIIATEMFVPRTRHLPDREIRDIQIVVNEWKSHDNSSASILLLKKIIVNLLNEIRALRFNSIDEFITDLEKVKKEVMQ